MSNNGLRDALRAAVGTTDGDEGLPHWHHATGGTGATPAENDRDGVFVDRQQVLDLIDRLVPAEAAAIHQQDTDRAAR